MPRNGNGEYDLPAGNPVVPGTVIESEWANNTMNDLAVALTDSLTADGQTTPVSNLPMGGYHHTGVSDPTLRNQYATLGMSQDGRNSRIQITGGVDNLTGTLVGGSTAYSSGAILSFFAPANNTGPMTLSYNGIAAASIVTSQGLPLQAADVVAGKNYLVQYTGTVFQFLSPVSSQSGNLYNQSSVTGWRRPESGTYPPLVLASGTSINVPAGSGVIIPPGADGANDAQLVSWDAQSVTLTYLTTSFTTTIAVSSSGMITQFAGRITGANERDYIVLGVAVHVNGVATSVVTAPAIFGDNGYLGVDTANVLTNVLIAGGETTPNGANLQLNVAAGLISNPGGASNTPNSPNTIQLVGGSPISFRTLAGQGTIGASTTTVAPVTSYDPNGAGVVTALPANGDATIHRLYYVYGEFVWVYGQYLYTSVDAALLRLEVDRSKYNPSLRLNDACLIAEIISTKANTDLTSANTAIIVYGGAYYSIGSSGGISDAPSDGQTYGRRNATWSVTVAANNPQLTGDITLTDGTPRLNQVMSPVTAGYMGLNAKQLGFDWCNIEITQPDDKTYLRSYNPANGNLRNTTTWDLATGRWTFPEAAFVAAAGSATDTTAGRVLKVGDFGVGGALLVVGNANLVPLGGSITVLSAPFTNAPLAGNYFTLFSDTDATDGSQIAVSYSGGAPRQFFRTKNASSWTPWVEVWTTSNLVKTTSATDTTAGSMLKVGDFGVGVLGSGVGVGNLDSTALASGLYIWSAGSSPTGTKPTGSLANAVVLVERFSSTILKQTWTDINGGTAVDPRTWVRTSYAANTWGVWAEVATSGSSPTFGNITATGAITASGNITATGAITASGNITAYSDVRLKKNIEVIPNALYKVGMLSGYTFDRTDCNLRQTGLIAQELQAVLPEAVMQGADGMLSVAYGNVVGLVVEAIKELRSEVEELRRDLTL